MAGKRVLVVGLGNMGLSHAMAYARIDGFEVAGVCERSIAERTLPDALAGRRALHRLRQGARQPQAGRRLHLHLGRHPCRLRHQGDGGGRPCLRREAARRDGRGRPSASSPRRGEPAASSSSAISCATIRAGRSSSSSPARWARRYVFRMNLNQQSSGAAVGDPQAAAPVAVADRRLRRPLCRRVVPDHARRRRSPSMRSAPG